MVTLIHCGMQLTMDIVQEYERRFLVWLDNMEYAHAHNEKQSSFKVCRNISDNPAMPISAFSQAWDSLDIHGIAASAE